MEAYIPQLLIAIPALPLAAAVIVAALGKRVLRQQSHWPVVLALVGSCAASLALIFAVQQGGKEHSEHLVRLWTWAAVGPGATGEPSFHVDIVLRADPLTAIMLAMVTFISTLVAIYSIGYMHGDRGLLAVLRLRRPVRLLDDDARLGQQLRAAVRLLGSGGPVQLSADRLLVSRSPRRPRPARRRFWSIASATSASPWACS